MDINQHTDELLAGWNPLTLDEINEIHKGTQTYDYQRLHYRVHAARLSN